MRPGPGYCTRRPHRPDCDGRADVLVSFNVGPEVTGLVVNGGVLEVETMVPATTGSNSAGAPVPSTLSSKRFVPCWFI